MPDSIKTDYLVVGAGAAGMAFTDSLLAHSNATVTMVDRRQAPGGHWLDAYPFVRLHQPSAFYGVDSEPLGEDRIDVTGMNAGYYEVAGANEIRAYYAHVMQRRFLASGRVRYLPSCNYLGHGQIAARLTSHTWQVEVQQRVVDTTYLEGAVPATSAPPFTVAEGVRCVPPGALVSLRERPERFVIIGAGKTAADTCLWLLEQGVPASNIQWIQPRDAWWLNRHFFQPQAMLPEMHRGMAVQFEAMAHASSVPDLFARLEHDGFINRLDAAVTPTMFRGAILGETELVRLREIRDIVRLGRVQRIDHEVITLDAGEVPTNERTLHVHCAARGLAQPPQRPVFEPGLITVQPFRWGFACLQFALLGVIEATALSDEEKNVLCPPIPWWNTNTDYLSAFLATLVNERALAAYPELAAWAASSRLNPLAGIERHREHPTVVESRARLKRLSAAALSNLHSLISASKQSGNVP